MVLIDFLVASGVADGVLRSKMDVYPSCFTGRVKYSGIWFNLFC